MDKIKITYPSNCSTSKIIGDEKIQLDMVKKNMSMAYCQMSIGEILLMHEDNLIKLRPFNSNHLIWSIEQKSCFIESLLMGIPVSPFYMSLDDVDWNVIDGNSRLLSIFDFIGSYHKNNADIIDEKCYNLSSGLTSLDFLSGMGWSDFPRMIQFEFKRVKLDFWFLNKKKNDGEKLEIYKRLNME